MAYRYEKNSDTGKPEIVIDGWEEGIAESPYKGITSIKNLNIKYLPDAVYSNYKRILNSPASGIGILKYWTQDPKTGTYYIIDNGGLVWYSTDPSNVGQPWAQLTGNAAHLGQGQGIGVFKNYLFVFKATAIDYYNISGASWTFDWKTGLQSAEHMALWGQDDIFYFCNGRYVGSLAEVFGMTFDPSNAATYTYNAIALTLPSYDVASWLSELRVNLMIAAGKRIYPWDRTSTSYTIPIFVKENIVKVINVLNILYIIAGTKGQIYISNGYSVSPYRKLPDSFFSGIDPQITWGDMMYYRNRLFLGACQSGVASGISGIFSVDFETSALNFENQNSYGANTTSGVNGAANILIPIMDTSYVSGWYNGSSGGMDRNDTTIYTNFECAIETDLIPVGTFLQSHSFDNIEFKLDSQMQSADSIKVSMRASISDAYTLIGQTTSTILSDVYTPLSVQKNQWVQLKIEMKSGQTGQYVRLREMRIR